MIIIRSHLTKVRWIMLHTKFQCSVLSGFIQEDCFMVSHVSLCKTCDQRGGPMVSYKGVSFEVNVEY